MKSDKIIDAMDFLPDEMLEETDRIRRKKPIKWWKPIVAAAACLCLVFGTMFLFAAGGATESNDKATAEIGMAMDPASPNYSYMADGSASGSATSDVVSPQLNQEKLVRTVTMDAETEELDPLITGVEDKIKELSGYVELRDVYNGGMDAKRRTRHVDLTLRIPADRVDAFIAYMQESTHIVSTNETVENIALSYVATESRINALKVEEERLLELLKKANSTSDIIQIEQRLSQVRSELERMTSQLLIYDNMIDYGTVILTVTEVKEYTEIQEPETVWDRITSGWEDSFDSVGEFFTDLFVFFVVALPYLAILAAVLTVVIIIIRRKKRKK